MKKSKYRYDYTGVNGFGSIQIEACDLAVSEVYIDRHVCSLRDCDCVRGKWVRQNWIVLCRWPYHEILDRVLHYNLRLSAKIYEVKCSIIKGWTKGSIIGLKIWNKHRVRKYKQYRHFFLRSIFVNYTWN